MAILNGRNISEAFETALSWCEHPAEAKQAIESMLKQLHADGHISEAFSRPLQPVMEGLAEHLDRVALENASPSSYGSVVSLLAQGRRPLCSRDCVSVETWKRVQESSRVLMDVTSARAAADADFLTRPVTYLDYPTDQYSYGEALQMLNWNFSGAGFDILSHGQKAWTETKAMMQALREMAHGTSFAEATRGLPEETQTAIREMLEELDQRAPNLFPVGSPMHTAIELGREPALSDQQKAAQLCYTGLQNMHEMLHAGNTLRGCADAIKPLCNEVSHSRPLPPAVTCYTGDSKAFIDMEHDWTGQGHYSICFDLPNHPDVAQQLSRLNRALRARAPENPLMPYNFVYYDEKAFDQVTRELLAERAEGKVRSMLGYMLDENSPRTQKFYELQDAVTALKGLERDTGMPVHLNPEAHIGPKRPVLKSELDTPSPPSSPPPPPPPDGAASGPAR